MRIKNIGSNQTAVVSKLPNGGTVEVLFSYETPVAVRGPTLDYKTDRRWSVTTSKHINKFLAGIDVGTTGVRCMLFDSQGKLVSSAHR